jgi:hypothetical protein
MFRNSRNDLNTKPFVRSGAVSFTRKKVTIYVGLISGPWLGAADAGQADDEPVLVSTWRALTLSPAVS